MACGQRTREVDYIVQGSPGDSVFLVSPQNREAQEFLTRHIDPDSQWLGSSLAVEHGYIEGIIQNLQREGWTVR